MRTLHWRVGPLGDWTENPNQTVFISGFKIAIRDKILGRKRVEVRVDADAPSTHLKARRFFSDGGGHSRVGGLWRRLMSRSGGNKQAGERAEADSVDDSRTDPAPDDMDIGGRVTVTHVPEILQVCAK